MAQVRNLLLAVACLASLIGLGRPAAAATTGYELTFGASDFSPLFNTAVPPVGFVLGQFAFSLDPTQGSSGSVTADFINLPHGTLGYSYGATLGHLIIGGTLTGVGGVGSGVDDFYLIVDNFNTVPTFTAFVYGLATGGGLFQSNNGSVHVNVTATPIPGALPLFVSAIGGMGLIGWRRRRAA